MGVTNLPVSPLAPKSFPELPEVGGVELTTFALGLYSGTSRDDLLVVHFPNGAAPGGVFTTSSTRSADVDWCRSALKSSEVRARALVVNAGNSNAFTGQAGIEKNRATTDAVVGLAGCVDTNVFLAATGVIGEPLPPTRVADGVRAAWPALGMPNWEKAANAIRTTDTFAKASGATTEIEGRAVNIVGIAKGSGMIAPNMATTLNYVFTDAPLSAKAAQALIARYCDLTYNCITVDSDTSTSDTLMVFATGASGGETIYDPDDPRLEGFRTKLHEVLKDLALQIVRDGEGARRLIEINVIGAADDHAARVIGASIANSPLVKTAMAAGDANWGRIVMAVGKSGEVVERDALAIWFSDHQVAKDGARAPDYSEAKASQAVSGELVRVRVDAGVGDGHATVWTCDLTEGYVKINGAYRS